MTGLRLAALFIGVACLFWVWLSLRRNPNTAMNRFVIYPTAIALIVAALFPGAYRATAGALGLEALPGGTLFMLLIAAAAASWIWLILLSERLERAEHLLGEVAVSSAANTFLDTLPREADQPGLLVIIPAFNEADNLPAVLARIPREAAGLSVHALVVDDGSLDATSEVARAHGAWAVRHSFNLGGGAAIRTGLRIADRIGAQACATLDADGQHDPGELDALAAPIVAGEADMVVGSRILGGGETYSRLRLAGVYVFSFMLRLLTGDPITDASSGYRVFATRKASRLRLTAMQYHTAETIILAVKAGLRIVERPVTISRRASGTSRKGGDFGYSLKFLASVVRAWWR